MRLQRWRLSYLPRQFEHVEAVAFVINSMSVWRCDALRRLGRFDEQLAIDHVDTDYCLRARHAGLRLYVNGRFEFAHSIGERRRFRLFGRELQAGGHSADRRRLIARNTVRLARAECLRLPAFGFLCLTRLAYELAGILMAEPQKWTKAMALLRGAASGMWAARLR
jgi:rhamnosyltransferase